MQLKLGEKIRELRRKNGVTQETLADKLGLTAQAISRWEMGGAYPDMEMIPPIANFFGITIDELFGYDGEREWKIDAIIARVSELRVESKSLSDPTLQPSIDESLSILRQGLAEFPGNERLMSELASYLTTAGYRRYGEYWSYDSDGYICHECCPNEYWDEAIKLYELLAHDSRDRKIVNDATVKLVNLYACTGKPEEAKKTAERLPFIRDSRELWYAYASSGREMSAAYGDAALTLMRELRNAVMQIILSNNNLYKTDIPIKKVRGLINLYGFMCDDGNLGWCHSDVACLCLYLSRLQWERGYRDEAFDSLDCALEHASAYDAFCTDPNSRFTAPLVADVKCGCGNKDPQSRKWLPHDWPWWSNPDYSDVEREIKSDPRWDAWVARTQE